MVAQVHVSYLEIYNQTGFDLLDPNREIKSMEDLPQVGSEHGYASSKPNRKMAGLCFVHGFQYRGRWFMLCAWFLILVGLVLNFGVLALAAVCCRNVCVWDTIPCDCCNQIAPQPGPHFQLPVRKQQSPSSVLVQGALRSRWWMAAARQPVMLVTSLSC